MADSALLAAINKKDINQFRKDILSMLIAGKEMDRHYNEGRISR